MKNNASIIPTNTSRCHATPFPVQIGTYDICTGILNPSIGTVQPPAIIIFSFPSTSGLSCSMVTKGPIQCETSLAFDIQIINVLSLLRHLDSCRLEIHYRSLRSPMRYQYSNVTLFITKKHHVWITKLASFYIRVPHSKTTADLDRHWLSFGKIHPCNQ